MHLARQKARFDWLVELGGASALALAGGYAALKAAPSLVLPGLAAMVAGSIACFGFGMIAMLAVKPAPRQHSLPDLTVGPVEIDELVLTDEFQQPLLLTEVYWDKALLLDDVLAEPDASSRVVQLFAAKQMPTSGELTQRIDCHLAAAPQLNLAPARPDATGALYAALDELKRSLS